MKEKIYTIPVTDALKEAEFCPFCYIKNKLEVETMEYTIGPSYMEDDIRAVSDELGFCERHFSVILNEQNKLGVALMSHTHIQKLIKDLEQLKDDNSIPKKSMFKKVSNPSNSNLVSYIEKSSKSCFMCSRIETTFRRYVDCFIYLINNDSAIKALFEASKGVCYSHLYTILSVAESTMKENEYLKFKDTLIAKTLNNFKNLEEDLDFFVKKFDYKNNHLPWGDKRDVLNRVSQNLK